MKIKLLKDVLIGNRSYSPGEVLDLEVKGDVKARLVRDGSAVYVPKERFIPDRPLQVRKIYRGKI